MVRSDMTSVNITYAGRIYNRGSSPRIRIISFLNVMKIHEKKHTNARRYCVCSAVLAVLTSKEIPLAFKLIKTGARMQLFENEFYLQGSFHCKLASSVEPNRPFGSTDKAKFLLGGGC